MKRLDNDTILKSTDPMQTTTTQKYLQNFFNKILIRKFSISNHKTPCFRMDYIHHQVNRIGLHQPDKYIQPEGEVETVSSYSMEYGCKFIIILKMSLILEKIIYQRSKLFKISIKIK